MHTTSTTHTGTTTTTSTKRNIICSGRPTGRTQINHYYSQNARAHALTNNKHINTQKKRPFLYFTATTPHSLPHYITQLRAIRIFVDGVVLVVVF